VPSSLLQCRTDEGGNLKLIVDAGNPRAVIKGGEYGVTSLARRQLADKLKIPFAYFERMRAEQPDCSTATSTPGCRLTATAG
jgi:hypothetical protein